MPLYRNHNPWTVKLVGPNGEEVRLRSGQSMELSQHYEQYKLRGFISSVEPKVVKQNVVRGNTGVARQIPELKRNARPTDPQREEVGRAIRVHKLKRITTSPKTAATRHDEKAVTKNVVVGRQINADAQEILKRNLNSSGYPVSNGIAIGILSYNRPDSLNRLLKSIVKYTDLNKTTIFVSDDCSTDTRVNEVLADFKNIVIIKNGERGGIATNSNRLLRCLRRFKYGILLNDDIEILKLGWEHYYVGALEKSRMHHLLYREAGVYNAKIGTEVDFNGVALYKVEDKPHGALLAFTSECLEKVGAFDPSYGLYGMEHVDWSMRAHEVGLQPAGFYDVAGSTGYVKLHDEQCSVEKDKKQELLSAAKTTFKNRILGFKPFDDRSKVASLSFIIPFKNVDRMDALETVINNVRAQRFPEIEIILVEHDPKRQVVQSRHDPIKFYRVSDSSDLFNKSMAFNLGVSHAEHDRVVLHDADMLVVGHYADKVYSILKDHSACHLGASVIYATKEDSEAIAQRQCVLGDARFERVVGYYEGGSLACTKEAYWACGGFNEDFKAYGCEDCDFYARMSSNNYYGIREFDLLHLWHPRTTGWEEHHARNKALEKSLIALSMPERIARQVAQMKKKGYVEEQK